MKNITFLALLSLSVICFASCKKLDDPAPANNDINYDLHNRIFRVKASSTATYTLTLTDYASDSSTPFNIIEANQNGPFDYGFTPEIGHTIKVTIRSEGKITASALYNGNYLSPPITVTDVTGGGSAVDYTFNVKN